MKRTALALALAGIMALTLTACGPKTTPTGGDTAGSYTVGVLQYAEHNALDEATRGFQEKLTALLGDKVTFDVKNAQGESTNCTTIATKFVNDKVSLVMANATPAAQAARQATGEIPILATSVTDFEAAGLVEKNDAPGRNVTGTSDRAIIEKQVELMGVLCPDVKNVGILYCSSEDNSIIQAQQATAAFEQAGYTVKSYTAADANELQPVVTKACGEVEGLYLPTDNLISSNLELIKNITVPKGVPSICGEESQVAAGALASYSINYYTLGEMTAQQAYEILVNGAKPATMPVQFVAEEDLKLSINEDVAKELNITIPAQLQK